jgi:hypothetical protein
VITPASRDAAATIFRGGRSRCYGRDWQQRRTLEPQTLCGRLKDATSPHDQSSTITRASDERGQDATGASPRQIPSSSPGIRRPLATSSIRGDADARRHRDGCCIRTHYCRAVASGSPRSVAELRRAVPTPCSGRNPGRRPWLGTWRGRSRAATTPSQEPGRCC